MSEESIARRGVAWTPADIIAVVGWSLLVVVAPLAFSSSAAATFFTAKLLPVYAGCGLLVLGAVLPRAKVEVERLNPGDRPEPGGVGLRRRASEALAAAFLALGLASVATASSVATAVLGTYNQGTGWLFWAAAVGGFFALRRSRLDGRLRRALLIGLVASGVVVAALAVLQAAHWEPLRFRLGFRVDGRAGSTLGNPLYSGAFLALAAILSLDLARRAHSGVGTALAAGAAALIVLGLGVSWSRGAWLALAMGAVVWAGSALLDSESGSRARVASLFVALAGWSLIVGLLVVPALAPARGVGVGAQGQEAAIEAGSSVETRLLMWGIAAEAALDRPLLGWGPNNYRFGAQQHMTAEKLELEPLTRDADAHSLFLEIAATWGIPAAVVLLGWFVTMGLALFRRRFEEDGAAAAGVLAAFLAGSLTMPQNLVVTPVALVVVGLALAGAAGGRGAKGVEGVEGTRRSGRAARVAPPVITGAVVLTLAVGSWAWYQADRHYLVGEIRGDMGELTEAAEGFPLVESYWRSLALAETREGIAQGRPLLVADGETHLRRGLSLSPRDMDLLAALTAAHLQRGEWKKARESAQLATSYSPVEPLPHAQLAYALLRLGETERALAEAERALAVDVRSARVLHTVGLYFRDSGDVERARATFERALLVDPRFTPARQELDRLP
ncbi:MAG: O-antigen ligase family protein [Actinobacteria bacterium]|nr:O-antigen ligase family protein [Actinomycetota bacterium]